MPVQRKPETLEMYPSTPREGLAVNFMLPWAVST